MRVVITGGGGFLGQKLAEHICTSGSLNGQPVDELVLFDVHKPPPPETGTMTVTCIAGDISDPDTVNSLIGAHCDCLFHLAAVVSGAAEADLDLGLRVNLDGTRYLLEACRRLSQSPRVIYPSSVAAYGGDHMPAVIGDHIELNPQNSYGTQKVMGELLVNDFSRRGIIDGRSLRLPTVVIRPGVANAAASSFASAVLREPLQGDDYACPVPAETPMWIASPRTTVQALLHGASLDARDFGSNRSVGLPGITVSVLQMLEAMERVAGKAARQRVTFEHDPAIHAIVAAWPASFQPDRALSLGFPQDQSIEHIIRFFLEDDLRPANDAQG